MATSKKAEKKSDTAKKQAKPKHTDTPSRTIPNQGIPNMIVNVFDPNTYAPLLDVWAKTGVSYLKQLETLQTMTVDRWKQGAQHRYQLAYDVMDRMVSLSTKANQTMQDQLTRLVA